MPNHVTIEPRANEPGWRLTCRLIVPRPVSDVFPFFADAHNLEELTPDTVRFNVLTPRPIEMKPGAIIDYKLKIKGVPIRWRTEIPVWDPPHQFVDNQIKGPYVLWHHTHTFEPVDNGKSTLVRDVVNYIPRGGPLRPLLHTLFIKRDLTHIFEYRSKKLAEIFGEVPEPAPVS
ncbi:MAG: SRPBCC family protein [Phycisphaerales bacterium]